MDTSSNGSLSTRCLLSVLCALSLVAGISLQAQDSVSLQNGGWAISVDSTRSTLKVAHQGVGEILRDVRLESGSVSAAPDQPARWKVSEQGQTRISIAAADGSSVWILEIHGNSLLISSTSPSAYLTADASAPLSRIPARLLDPEGFPVVWKGTNEAQEAYGGDEPASPSYLPRTRSQVSFYALGLAATEGFHSLFDRPSDTAIDFPQSTVMHRDAQDRSLLHLRIPVHGSAVLRVIPDYYTAVLGVPSYTAYPPDGAAPVIWNSWNAYYAAVTQSDIVASTDWLHAHLKDYGLQYVVLDAGYSNSIKGEGALWLDWKKDAFPSGPKWLAGYIRSKGFTPGVWIVPNTAAAPLKAHPDWYVRSKQGNIIYDYNTASLDSSNPKVLDFLKDEFTAFHDWGFSYFKFDGEHALPKSVPDLDRSLLYDALSDPTAVYRHRLQVIRNAIGPNSFLEACPAGRPLDGIGYFNSYSNGFDLYSNWDGMYSLFSAIYANSFLNHIATYVMPGEGLSLTPVMSIAEARKKRVAEAITTIEERESPTEYGTSDAEARTLVSLVSLTGVAYPVADYVLDLPSSRIDLLHRTLPTQPILPVDLFSRGSNITFTEFRDVRANDFVHHYPEIVDLKVNRGSVDYDVAAITNWRGNAQSKSLNFSEALGLDAQARYVVFDFWAQRPLGVFSNSLDLTIEPHDTRVVQIYPLADHPQIVGTSRHITGSFSLSGETWDSASRTLRATSKMIAGQPYSVWLHVPAEFAGRHAVVQISGQNAAQVRQHRDGEFLALTFQGQSDPIAWTITF